MPRIVLVNCCTAALLLAAVPTRAGETQKDDLSPQAVKAQKAVEEFLAKYKAAGARVSVITDCKELGKLFRDHQFVTVHFPEWPVPRVPEKPLTARNVFAVGKDDNRLHLTDTAGLERFFKDKLPAVQANQSLQEVADVWLRLSQEFVQDGFYKFEREQGKAVAADSSDGTRMGGTFLNVVPEMGNKGYLKAEIWVDAKGKFVKAVEANKVVQGIRPRCQATRLLDPDPVIRSICEQDLLVMGRAAQTYLMDQRAKASPELQREIDRVWHKILEQGR